MTRAVTQQQRDRERSVTFAVSLDFGMLVTFIVVSVVTGALTTIAVTVRGGLMLCIEIFALHIMKRVHRGRTAAFEFGSGKLEQVVNLLLGLSMLIGGLWIVVGALDLIRGTGDIASPGGYAAAAVFASFNTWENAIAWDAVRRAARGGGSLIMAGQLQVRRVKLMSSLLEQATLTVAAVSLDRVVSAWADAAGAILVVGVILHTAAGMLRAGLPDLLDQSVNEETQVAINRMLAKHFEDYDRLDRVRTRRSGDVVYAEVALAFRADLTNAEVNRRIDAMKASLREEIPGADVSILAASC